MSRISKALTRVLAVLALAAVALAIVLVISSSLESDDGDGGKEKPRAERRQENRQDRERDRSAPPKFYVVQPGDSLSLIAEKTGVSLERLQELNPEIDPQLLASGEKLRLR
jgi:LysM repeat protein